MDGRSGAPTWIRGFYGVVDVTAAAVDEAEVRAAQDLAARLIAGGAPVVQVRMKRAPARGLLTVARALREVTRSRGVALVVNDRLDVALAVGADGVHLGQDDLPLLDARAALAAVGRRLVVGISTHDPSQAEAAARAGADYLGFGPVFATRTKENPDPVQGLDALARAVVAAAPVPVVAIGGILVDAAPAVAATGAAAACVIAAVNGAPDVSAAARRVAEAFVPGA